MSVVIEPAGIRERGSQRFLPGMAEGWMAEVVGEAQRLGQVLVEAERTRHGPPNLRDLDAVGEPNPEMVAIGGGEHLRLVAEPPERHRMDDPVAVALEDVARSARAKVTFAMQAAARLRGLRGNALG
jgi:hypothetical protein